MEKFAEKYGAWAVVTGASTGIGAEYARQLAELQLNVVLVARREEVIEKIADEIESKYKVSTKRISVDLITEQGYKTVIEETERLDVGLLINNAGMVFSGNFLHSDFSKHASLISLNITAVSGLAHEFGRRFVKRGRGGLLFVSSKTKDKTPWMASYSSSKAFVSNLAYIMKFELKDTNVDITCSEPGAVATEMTQRMEFFKLGRPFINPSQCVKESLLALVQGKLRVTPGKENDVNADEMIMKGFAVTSKVMEEKWNPTIFHPGPTDATGE